MALKIFTTSQIRHIDADTIQLEGIPSAVLMERAAEGLFHIIKNYIPKDKSVLVLAGPGNNGGDALVLSGLMLKAGYQLKCILLSDNKKRSADCSLNAKKMQDFAPSSFVDNGSLRDLEQMQQVDYIIDGLFGSGLNKALEGFFAELVHWINQQKAQRISIDLPSGLYGEDNRNNLTDNIVKANLVLGIQFARLAFVLPENQEYIGKWMLSPLKFHPLAVSGQEHFYSIVEKRDLIDILHKRTLFSHKGHYGHGLLIAGSAAMSGAAILAGRAALRSGIGLLTLRVPTSTYTCVQTAIPEAIVNTDASSASCFSSLKNLDISAFSAIGIGPGLGTGSNQSAAMKKLLIKLHCPVVIDADGLNILAEHPSLLSLLPSGTVITPHPKEFDRLAGPSYCGYERLNKARDFAKQHQLYIILKGHYSCSIFPDGSCHFNATGNPGMATGGSGDVLTGILLSLLAQGYTPAKSSLLGTFLHGLCGDLALKEQSEESLLAGDLISYLGEAFKYCKEQS